ncbi:hypothetical protein HIM_06502 [Hirsutella minnesotensis 3608]|uniref:54S ribosomal protein subunit img1 n=1 Tax=Hirsutella minnesotensis 3608 TaxID=1043627 RepID=A0A0F7ZU11_9HYPO|nr:hypothetical protein HIM_06502 [Hirsutella minnesotensis 3608]
MNVAMVRRPLGCLKTVMRQNRQQRIPIRCLATEAATTSSPNSHAIYTPRQQSWKQKLDKFQVYAPIPSIRETHPDPMPALKEKQKAEMDPTGARSRLFDRSLPDCAKVGDVLMVTTKSGEPSAGAFIEIRRRGVDTAILLRGQLMKLGVEMWYKIYSPTVTGIDIVWRRPKRARRARLTYMRKPKHDMGSVDQYVFTWKQERAALRRTSSKKKATRPII